MIKVVVDTDVIIDYLRAKTGILLELLDLTRNEAIWLYCPSIVVLELFSGESSKKDRQVIEEILSAMTIINLDKDSAKKAGELKRNKKMDITVPDLIIGETTLSLDAQLATSNVKHFSQIPGLKFFKRKKKSN